MKRRNAAEGSQLNELTRVNRLRSADEAAAIVLPPGAEIGPFEAKRDLMEVLPLIQHHDALMARAALTQFLNLGQTQTGSHAPAAERRRN